MLKDILSISGRPGLFKLLTTTKNSFVVESLSDKRRLPVSAQERVVSLKEISVYSENGDIPLGEVFEKIFQKEQGKEVNLALIAKENQSLFDYLQEVLPDFDKNMVHANEIKKMLTWYNLLVEAGFDKFIKEEADGEENNSSDQGGLDENK